MNIIIRTDSSLEIGTGHVMRCITLAKQLKRENADITFICRDFPGSSHAFIESEGFNVHTLVSHDNQNQLQWIKDNWDQDAEETEMLLNKINKKIDLLIVDHYGIDVRWESRLRSFVDNIMVIDDLADRIHECDLILDQNSNKQDRYNLLVPNSCIQLLGLNYVLLRDEFLTIDVRKIQRDGSISTILVFFGGTDPTGETIKTIQSIKELGLVDIEFNIVVGSANPNKELIQEMCKKIPNTFFYCQVNNMADLMVKADLAIGAGGTASWERCYLGLPTIIICVAPNQKEVTNAIEAKGAAINLGTSEEVTVKRINKAIKDLYDNPKNVNKMIRSCLDIVRPKEVKRGMVVKTIMELLK
ncbi:UDP-2,4-diacetamido-2,4,6-trideoxy-beta-L-altropyranose hydrolase [Sutcliffiella halmapala]|uniref:UDP-2,4-diacetamido-2,4, 6-trideoxy-beta-L-altropyranose hydrolase n=1 Tax=Sutcliffiella halmapala TaxID=79882 RepID=UPI0009949E5B|nr:UDP-2,4-diacetamido-2,4,6-trideoxy-beta-L-altropyranose hydrolase [Sutcliffiella halmapala]